MNIYLIGITAGLIGVVLGYVIARLDGIYSLLRHQPVNNTPEPSSFFATKLDKKQTAVEARVAQVSIDERKFVADIKTDNIQKVNELELGNKTTQQDTINQSVSKLAQLKGR